MGRKIKDSWGENMPPSRFKCLCEKYRIDNGHLSITMFAEKLGEYKQSTLSHYETRAKGPPLELVEKYAHFFKLENKSRFDFFLAAIEASDEIVIDSSTISPFFREMFQKFLALTLSNVRVGKIPEAGLYTHYK